jgi:hypothetical protein
VRRHQADGACLCQPRPNGIVVFLASDDACFMTGEITHANGGLYMA